MTDRDTNGRVDFSHLSRRDFLKAAGAMLGGAVLAACVPQTVSAPDSDPSPEPTRTADIVGATDVEFSALVKDFAGAEFDHYDSEAKLQIDKPEQAKTEFALLSAFKVHVNSSVPNGAQDVIFGYGTFKGGVERIVAKIGKLDTGASQYATLEEVTLKDFKGIPGQVFNLDAIGVSTAPSVEGGVPPFFPIFSTRLNSDGSATNENYYLDVADTTQTYYYRLNQSFGKGASALFDIVPAGRDKIVEGQALMQESTDPGWNFNRKTDGSLNIIGGDGTLLYTYNATTLKWEAPQKPTPESPKFKVCTPESFKDCPITVDQLFDGTYLAWLKTLSKPFDPNQIKNVAFENFGGIYIVPEHRPAFMGGNAGKEAFRRDVTAGYISFQGHDYIVMPIEYYDAKDPTNNKWVITVNDFGGSTNPDDEKQYIQAWRTQMNITAIVPTDINADTKSVDPLVKRTFDNFKDMDVRVGAFVGYNTGYPADYKGRTLWPTNGPDLTALGNVPGMVLLNLIVFGSSDNSFK